MTCIKLANSLIIQTDYRVFWLMGSRSALRAADPRFPLRSGRRTILVYVLFSFPSERRRFRLVNNGCQRSHNRHPVVVTKFIVSIPDKTFSPRVCSPTRPPAARTKRFHAFFPRRKLAKYNVIGGRLPRSFRFYFGNFVLKKSQYFTTLKNNHLL